MELGLDVRKVDEHSVVDVKGEIDVYTAPKLREKLIELVSEGSYDVVVNLEGVDFLDSTGLGVLVGALKRVKAHDGNFVTGGTIIVRQRGRRFRPGLNAGLGKDDTIFAKIAGRVRFENHGAKGRVISIRADE